MNNLIKSVVTTMLFGGSISAQAPKIKTSQTELRQIEVLKDLAKETNTDTNQIRKNWEKWEYKRECSIQRSIDSLAYKQLFDGTKLANDSAAVKEFNEITKMTSPHPRHSLHTYIQQDYDQIMSDLGCEEKEIYRTRANCMEVYSTRSNGELHFTNEGNINAVARRQYLTDSIAYNRFFGKNGLLNNNMKKQIVQLAKKIKP